MIPDAMSMRFTDELRRYSCEPSPRLPAALGRFDPARVFADRGALSVSEC